MSSPIKIDKYEIVNVIKTNQKPQKESRVFPLIRDGSYCEFQLPVITTEPGVFLWHIDGVCDHIGGTRNNLRVALQNYSKIKPQDTDQKGGNPTYTRVNDALNTAFVAKQSVVLTCVSLDREALQRDPDSLNFGDLKDLLLSVHRPRLNLR